MARKNPFLALSLTGSGFAPCPLEEHVKQTIRACVLTRRGERSLRPGLGSRVIDLLFRPMISDIKNEIAQAIREAIEASEPRVEMIGVSVEADAREPGGLAAQIRYRVKETRRTDQLTLSLSS